jgi:flagellar protein FliS
MSTQMMRNRYVSDSVATASPARLVTMLYDRLVRDLFAAEAALDAADLEVANDQLVHAQDILWELLAGLDVTKWSGGPGLAALYQFLISELVAANVGKDAARVASCRELVEPLRDAWHRAAEAVVMGTAPERVSA